MADSESAYSIEQVIADAQAAIASDGMTGKGLRTIGERLLQLSEAQQLLHTSELTNMHGTESAATVLHSEGPDGLTLVLAKFTDQAPTPVHDHGAWAVACVVQGRDHYSTWERLDDGADPERSQLRLVSERTLEPGDIVYWLDPPHDIHSQQGIDGPVWELILFGRNTMIMPRHYFDTQTGNVREALPL
jgi:predicted metal-dependent enzyme (double-stranded beta helix superfamily)